MEAGLGERFGDVRVHTDARAARLAAGMSARAFTVGSDIAFGGGQPQPGTIVGDAILAHELAHTVQQRGGGRGHSAPSDALEQQADGAAISTFQGERSAPLAQGGLRIQRCNGDKDKTEAGPTVTPATPQSSQGPVPTQPVPAPAPTGVAAVKSLEVENLKSNLQGSWAGVQRKFTQRENQLSEATGLVKDGSTEQERIDRMRARLVDLRAAVTNTSYIPESSSTTWSANTSADLTADAADASAMSGKFKFLPAAISQLSSAVTKYLAGRTMLGEEKTQFARFDPKFGTADVGTLLKAANPAVFDAADVKALMAQESSDFTNIKIKGLEGKTGGVINKRVNAAFVGAAQFNAAAMADAIAWAGGKGVTIPSSPDPRADVGSSILLATAYLGWNVDRLRLGLPAPMPGDAELRKLVLAAYNGGFRNVVKAANTMAGKPYSWDDIKNKPTISGQMRDYVSRILMRL
jgi:hypothetical protein